MLKSLNLPSSKSTFSTSYLTTFSTTALTGDGAFSAFAFTATAVSVLASSTRSVAFSRTGAATLSLIYYVWGLPTGAGTPLFLAASLVLKQVAHAIFNSYVIIKLLYSM